MSARERAAAATLGEAHATRVDLEFSHCTVRTWQRTDVPALVASADDYEVWRQLRDRFPHPYTARDATRWVRSASTARPQTSFAIVAEGTVVGGLGIQVQDDVYRRSGEIGYWVGRAHQRHGYASEAVQGFTQWAFAAYDLCRIFACVFETNPASQRVLEKAGFRLEARMQASVTKEGRTMDQFLYARIDPSRILRPPRPAAVEQDAS